MKRKFVKFLIVFIVLILLLFLCFLIMDELNIINLKNNSSDLKEQNNTNFNAEENATENNNQSQVNYEVKETDFTLIDQNGNKVSLADYRGKKVVILYWAVWCPPCKEEIPVIDELNKEYNNAVFLTIVSPTLGENSEYDTYQEEIADYIKTNNIEVPVLIDEGKKCFDIYGIERYPSTIFIDEYGNVKEKLGSKEESGKLSKDEIISKLEQY